jgi:hypothetical protein
MANHNLKPVLDEIQDMVRGHPDTGEWFLEGPFFLRKFDGVATQGNNDSLMIPVHIPPVHISAPSPHPFG